MLSSYILHANAFEISSYPHIYYQQIMHTKKHKSGGHGAMQQCTFKLLAIGSCTLYAYNYHQLLKTTLKGMLGHSLGCLTSRFRSKFIWRAVSIPWIMAAPFPYSDRISAVRLDPGCSFGASTVRSFWSLRTVGQEKTLIKKKNSHVSVWIIFKEESPNR